MVDVISVKEVDNHRGVLFLCTSSFIAWLLKSIAQTFVCERLIGKASKQMQVRMVYILPTNRVNIPAEISAIRITLIKHGLAFLDEVTQFRPFFLVYIKRRLDVANKAYSPLSFKIETSLLLL